MHFKPFYCVQNMSLEKYPSLICLILRFFGNSKLLCEKSDKVHTSHPNQCGFISKLVQCHLLAAFHNIWAESQKLGSAFSAWICFVDWTAIHFTISNTNQVGSSGKFFFIDLGHSNIYISYVSDREWFIFFCPPWHFSVELISTLNKYPTENHKAQTNQQRLL